MNDQHDDADQFWGGHDDWRPAPARTPSGRGGIATRLRSGVHAALDLGSGATREHRRVDAATTRSDVSAADPTPVQPQRDLLDGWPEDDDVAVGFAARTSSPGGGSGSAGIAPAVAASTAAPEVDLSYGHDDHAYAGLSDLADDDPLLDGSRRGTRSAGAAVTGRTVRVHGAPAAAASAAAASAAMAESAAGDETEGGAGWDPPGPARPAGGIDPRLRRFGLVAVVVTLLVPVVLGFRSDGDGDGEVATETPSTVPEADDPVEPAETSVTTVPTVVIDASTAASVPESAPDAPSASTDAPSASSSSSAAEPADTGSTSGSASTAASASAASAEAVATAPSCAIEYDVVSGDYWLRLADGAGVALSDLLAANGANSDTPLYPGRTICLPAGASRPSPPPAPTTEAVTAPASDASSSPSTSTAATAPPTTAAPTTAAPATTPPTTVPPATTPPTTPSPSYTETEVHQIIRAVWPDDLEERALEIADRESTFVPTAKNFCCYGLFQIYWEVHRGWLADLGITSAEQLFDPETNARAAYALYQRSGGWGPWGF